MDQKTDSTFVTLRVPREHAQPVRDLVTDHLTELPIAIRGDVQTQLSGWGIPAGSTDARGGGENTSRQDTSRR